MQRHYEFLSDYRRHQMALQQAAGVRPALTALPLDAVRAPSLLPPMPRLPSTSASSQGDPEQLTSQLEAAIAAVLQGSTDVPVHGGLTEPQHAVEMKVEGCNDRSDESCNTGRLDNTLGSGLYRLPSDAQLLSFASCIAA